MLNWIANFKVRTKLFLLDAVALAGLLVFAVATLMALNRVKVNGPIYRQIVMHKDLVADILPPPEYLIETFLVAHQLRDENDPAAVHALTQSYATLRQAYLDRQAYWQSVLPEGELRSLLRTSHVSAMKILELMDNEYMPAVRRHDTQTLRRLLDGPLKEVYGEHRAAIDAVTRSAERSSSQVEESSRTQTRAVELETAVLALLITLSLAITSIVLIRLITRPLVQGVAFANAIADGDLRGQLVVEQEDEVGDLARAMQRMKENLRRLVSEMGGQVSAVGASSSALQRLSQDTLGRVSEISAKTNSVAAAAEESSTNTVSVVANMEQAASNLASVAAATEQMSATVGEIAANSEKARAISEQAAQDATSTTSFMGRLGEAANQIGQVSESIMAISAQTNLLALNATIEAARAGQHGKGFAVVANEIKELAAQTATATVDIKEKVSHVQEYTRNAIGDIERISATIDEVQAIVAAIAAAIEQQSTVTKNVAQNVAEASSGVKDANDRLAQTANAAKEIAGDIARIGQDATGVDEDGRRVASSASDLSQSGQRLSAVVAKFAL